MSIYTQAVNRIEAKYERKLELEKIINKLNEEIDEANEEYASMLEALEYIGIMSEKRANEVLDFITGVINNTLAKIFPNTRRSIQLERKLYRQAYTHINIKLVVEDGVVRDLGTQTGKGLKQIISTLFMLTLIEVRKERRIIVMDELLNGLHLKAKQIMADILTMFADDGFQIIMIEYGINDIGKTYLVENKGGKATITEFQGSYTDDIVYSEESEEIHVDNNEYSPVIKGLEPITLD